MNYYNQFTTQTSGPVVVYSCRDSISEEEMTGKQIIELAKKHEHLSRKRGKGIVSLYLLGAAIISLGEISVYQAWKGMDLIVLVLGVVAVLVGSYFVFCSAVKRLNKVMHQEVFDLIVDASSFKEACRIDREAENWRWWSFEPLR